MGLGRFSHFKFELFIIDETPPYTVSDTKAKKLKRKVKKFQIKLFGIANDLLKSINDLFEIMNIIFEIMNTMVTKTLICSKMWKMPELFLLEKHLFL